MQVNDVALEYASGYGLMDDIRGFLSMAVAKDESVGTEGDCWFAWFVTV